MSFNLRSSCEWLERISAPSPSGFLERLPRSLDTAGSTVAGPNSSILQLKGLPKVRPLNYLGGTLVGSSVVQAELLAPFCGFLLLHSYCFVVLFLGVCKCKCIRIYTLIMYVYVCVCFIHSLSLSLSLSLRPHPKATAALLPPATTAAVAAVQTPLHRNAWRLRQNRGLVGLSSPSLLEYVWAQWVCIPHPMVY